jgi:hypothetical protein
LSSPPSSPYSPSSAAGELSRYGGSAPFSSEGVYSPLKGQCLEIFDFRFFHESVPPKFLSIP